MVEHLTGIEDRTVPRRQHRANRAREPHLVARERPARRHVQHVTRAEPANRQDGRVARRLDRQPAVGGHRRRGFRLERRAAEELPERRLQQVVVERAGGKYRRKGHQFSIIIQGMARRTLIDFFADLSQAGGEFVVYDDGYRRWSYTYRDLARAAEGVAARPPVG